MTFKDSHNMRAKITLMASLLFVNSALACDAPQAMANIQSMVAKKLLSNAPTFRHGWEDKAIQMQLINPQKGAENCQVTLQITFPQQDIDEVNAVLDAQPKRRILLGAQGYSVPDSTVSHAEYFYRLEGNNVIPENDKNTALKGLMSSIEYMYQSLAQSRIVLKDDASNNLAWDKATVEASLGYCQTKFALFDANAVVLKDACICRTQKLSKVLTTRQMELVAFVQSQPYSAATGVLKTFINLSQNINESCGLVSKN
jgi:hypothetical protein